MVHLFTSFTYNDPCLLVKAGRAFFRFNYYISKPPIPLEKVGWGISLLICYSSTEMGLEYQLG